ncbi:MAG TPA: SsrA-binding protein SmpB [Candidatus Paceibacterota bacterium]|nr:SsrA-binding protein SmpB [Candidatus Pacearchaeota archaeon]HRZ51351.1 SsrA-binding protein SmpB [Candidatus Paceibacterota bacterium]HSA37073.1 SsrA-binding protein SmpB [Candidatus Paceibacterota bacterium]
MKLLAENKKARYDYEIGEKFEAGIILSGQEVKSLKTRGISLAGSYVLVKNNGIFWIGAKVLAYQPKNVSLSYDPERTRKLLLKKSEIRYLTGKSAQRGLTFVPIRLYTKGRSDGSGKIKLEFAVARGKKKYDKRETIKKRETQLEINRALKQCR